jgi:hypothetical protein
MPCRRLLESSDLAEEHNVELRRRAAQFNSVTLKREMDEARERLLKLAVQRAYMINNFLAERTL